MISYSVYKIVHFLGIFMMFMSLGGLAIHTINSGEKNHASRKRIAITHGIGLFLVLLGGFGLLARLGIVHGGLPTWVWVKLAIWVTFGGLIAVLIRKPRWAKMLWPTMLALGVVAAYLAGYKPV